ncbi:MAG: glycoside hydrolase family 32 protein [Lachnospiraceae bacterium]|jgi:sucrose-6-phosphate hydrolase SacC (GH32 family)
MKQYTPNLHFAAKQGWINDPNGLVYHDGQYELYYQFNPKGYVWNNMSWGHAVSTDLLHWKDLPMVMEPDEFGMMFSGCALMNTRGLLGLPKTAIIYYYTTAGHTSEISKDKNYDILWAYSLDGGLTIHKTREKVLTAMGRENRDPAVFYHEPSGAYIMVIWISGNDFGIFRSEDMRHFTLSQKVTLQGGYECPDLFRLPVYGTDGKKNGEEKWVFWNADCSYFIGDFDGYSFTPQQFPRYAYTNGKTSIAYAAQTWSDDPKGRVLQTAWLRTKNVAAKTTGVMCLPRELSLVHGTFMEIHNGGPTDLYTLKMDLPEEITSQMKPLGTVSAASPELSVPEGVICLDLTLDSDMDLTLKDADGAELLTIRYIAAEGDLLFYHQQAGEIMGVGRAKKVQILYDRGIIESSWDNGCCTNITDVPENRLLTCAGLSLTQAGSGKNEIAVSMLR